MTMPVAYVCYAISTPYALGGRVWRRHVQSVELLASDVVLAGYAPIVPQLLPGLTHRQAMRADHHLVRLADVLVVHQSQWTATSKGVAREVAWARELGTPVVFSAEELRQLRPTLEAVS